MTASAVGSLAAPQPTSQAVRCAHCSLPVLPSDVAVEGPSFCCAGCRAVYAIVQSAGLGSYYAYRDPARPAPAPSIAKSPRKYQELDDPSFQAEHVVLDASGCPSADLLLEGIHCSACVWLVERVGRVVPGVIQS